MIEHVAMNLLESGLTHIMDSPHDNGILHMIVSRPNKKERSTPVRCSLTRKGGIEGDHWANGCWKSLPDGSPDPTVQITIMNSRCLDLIATNKSRWPLAGDNLIVDMDLGVQNLKAGQKLSLGSSVLEITDVPHTGCIKFRDRFGIDALKFVSIKTAKEMRLRGVYAQVIQDGEIQIGDHLKKLTIKG
jgi:MOSC domain-containing protein YiiM